MIVPAILLVALAQSPMDHQSLKLELLRGMPPEQFDAARKIVLLGGNVWQKNPPDDPRPSIVAFEGENFKDAQIPLLQPFRNADLYGIAFVNAGVSEQAISRALSEFSKIKSFCVTQMSIGDSAVLPLSELRNLRDVQLSRTKVTSVTLPLIGQQRELTDLDLTNTGVDDSGINHLENLSKLTQLSLSQTKITSTALASIGKLTNLERLAIYDTQIDDEGLRYLANLKKLRDLWIGGTNVTNAGMVHVAQLSGLVILDLRSTKVDAGGLALLQKMPKLREVNWEKSGSTLENRRFDARLHLYLPGNSDRWHEQRAQFDRGELKID